MTTLTMTTHYHDNSWQCSWDICVRREMYIFIPTFMLDGVGVQSSHEGGRPAWKLHGHQRPGTRYTYCRLAILVGTSLLVSCVGIVSMTHDCHSSSSWDSLHDCHSSSSLSLLPAQTMVDLVKGKSSMDDFALAMDETLGEFEFPDDFVIDVWTAVESVRNTKDP